MIQKDPLLTPATSIAGIRPKQLVEPEYHGYPDNDKDRVQTIQECAMYIDQYNLTEKQIRADVILSRQLQEEEREQYLKLSSQVEYDMPPEYHIGKVDARKKRNIRMNNFKRQVTDILVDKL